MSPLWIGLIGATVGLMVGYFVTRSRQGVVIDLIAGAIGAWLAVLLSRVVVPVMGNGVVMSSIVAVIGALVMLLLMKRFMRARLTAAPRSRRRM